jgi:hypothetical protein
MRPERERKKKLIVAFHFAIAGAQSTNQAGWDCDSCRKHGLELKRRCGFRAGDRGAPHIVWGRKRVQTDECPKSFVTGESLSLVEEFFVRRRLDMRETPDVDARKVDAFVILRDEMEREQADGTSQH